jgi:mxaL protein
MNRSFTGPGRAAGVIARLRTALRATTRTTRLLAGAALLLALALLGPRWPLPQPHWQHVVYIDITQSMNTRDMTVAGQPASRLAFARHALHEALRALPCGSQLGLGLFSEYRVLLLMKPVEVCANYDDLLAVIGRIDGRMSWAGASEVSKGVSWAVRTTRELDGEPTLMFITDGHEAPPLRPGYQPVFSVPGAPPGRVVHGSLLGVGGQPLSPIPKFDPDGHPLGLWQPDEVMQTDTISAGRTIGGNQQSLVEEDGSPVKVYESSGTEHLSSLKEAHLRGVAELAGLHYRRVADAGDMVAALRDGRLAREAVVARDLRAVPAALALVLMAAVYASWSRGARSSRASGLPGAWRRFLER